MNQPFQIRNIFTPSPASSPHPPAPLPADQRPTSRERIVHEVGEWQAKAGPRSRRHPYSLLHTPYSLLKWLIVGGPPQVRLAAEELDKTRRRLALSVGIILLIILIVSGIFGLYRRREIIRQERLASFSQRADWITSQADQLSAISPARAGELIREERLSLEAEVENANDEKLVPSLKKIIYNLELAQARVSRVETVTPELYLSLGLIRPDTSGRLLSAGQDRLGILSDDGVALLVSMSGRSGEVIGGGELIKNSIDLTVSATNTFVLNPDNIVEINSQNKTSAVALAAEDDVWQDPIRLSAFAGSLFVFDRSVSEIYKYPAAETGYGSRRRWLAPGIAPDLSDVIDMAIDGDIWLLHQDGRLDRYRRGAPAGFKQSGLLDQLTSPQAVSVPQDGSRVWILDNSSRVVAFDKESGEYAGQWQFTDINPTDLAVSETSAKIFLLAGENLYVVNLKAP